MFPDSTVMLRVALEAIMLNKGSGGDFLFLLSLLSAYVYSDINRAVAHHQNPHAIPVLLLTAHSQQNNGTVILSAHDTKGERGGFLV